MHALQIVRVDRSKGLGERGAQYPLVNEVGDVAQEMMLAIMSGVWNDERVRIVPPTTAHG